MLMKVRIRENIYLPTEFTTDWCESPITKKELCSKYNLNLEACDFYNDRGELVRGPELDGEQVTILQRPMGITGAIILGAAALVAAGGSIAYSIYQKNRAEERAKNQKKLSNIYSYSLRGSTNDQRQYSPIPVVLGKVNVAGDKAGLQYSTYASNHQDVHQLICVGYSGKEYHRIDENTVELVDVSAETEIANYTIPVGGVVFDKASEYVKQDTNPQGCIVRIADSPVDTFDNMYVDTQTGSDNNPTYYTERAIEISQMSELQGNPDSDSRYSAIIQTSPKNTIKIRVGVYAPYGYYKTNDDAEKISTSYNYTVQYRKVGTSEWTTLDNPNGSMNQSAYRNLIESSTLSADQYQVRVFRNDYGTYYEWDSEAQQFKLKDSTTCITLSAEIIQFVTRAEGLEGERGTRPIPYPGKYSLLSIKARANDRTNGWLEKVFTEVHLRCRTYGGPMPSYPGESLPACTPSMWVFPTTSDTLRSVISNNTSWHCLLDGGNLIGTISPLTLPYVLKDGSVYRTVYSVTFESDGKYIVLPLVYEQALHTREQAWQHYLDSNEYMGKFDTLEESETFAVAWHEFDEWKINRFYNKTTDTWCTDDLSYLEVARMNNPASVLLYILTCPQVNPRPVSYKDIDWESLRRWWLFCNDRRWTVNAFVTEVMSVAELAQLVCAAGRAHLVMSNNKFSVAIEDQTSVITQIFTPRNAWNMVQSKSLEEPTTLLKCAFVNDETEVEENRYIRFQLDANGNIDRTGGHVTIKFDDAEEVLLEESNYKSESTDFWGVTNADQIGQLGAYQLYKGLCLNNKYTWECGLESLSCTVGDVVYLANDVFASSLGYGRIKGVKKNDNQQIVGVYIDESVEIHERQTYGLTIRTGAGEIASKALFAVQNRGDNPQLEDNIVLAIDETNSSRNYLQFERPLPSNSDVTSGNLFIYNDAEQLGKKVIIESIQPNSDRGATITAVDYIPEMYTIDIRTEIPIYKSTINKYGTGANIAGGYTRWDQPNEAEIKGKAGTTITEIRYGVSSSDSTEPSSWSSSVPAVNKGDWLWVRVTYSDSNVQYTKSYIGTDGDDATIVGYVYEIEHKLSTSDSVFTLASGVTDWCKGLYVWSRIKITDPDGNVTYETPVYAKDTTESLYASCVFEILPTSAFYTVNHANSTGSKTYMATLAFTGYSSSDASNPITAVSVLNEDNTSTGISNVTWSGSTVSFDVAYDTTANQIKISVTGRFGETASCYMNADDQTQYNPFGGVFPTIKDDVSTISDADALATTWFTSEYGGVIEGATYSLNISGQNLLALRTWLGNSWAFLSQSSFDKPRISEICGKAQQAVLSLVSAGSVTASDYGYFNVLVANIVTADFIGAKQIQIQEDAQGNPGYIYGFDHTSGNVTPSGIKGQRVSGKAFIIDSDGVSEFSESYTKNQYAENINMTGTLNMYRNYDTSTDDAGADILHPAFSTTPAIEGDPTGISILIPAASGITTYDPTIPASKLTNTNTIITSGISGTFKGNSIAKMARITNASVVAIPSKTGSSGTITPTITGSVSALTIYEATSTFTVPSDTHNYPTKTISVTANISNSWANPQTWGAVYGSATLTVNGTTIGSTNIPQSSDVPYSISVSGTASLGDTVTLKVQLSVFGFKSWSTMNVSWSTGSRSFSDVGMTTGLWLYSNNSWTNLGTSAITESSNRLVVSTPFYYNSQYFVLPSTLFNYTSYTVDGTTYNIELGRAYKAEGKLIIDGTSNIALNTFVRTSSGVMFYTDNGEYFFARGKQYYISTQANIKILGSTRGIAMEGCYPKKNFNNNGGYDCGTSGLKWNYGWFNVCNANQFNDTSRAEDKENIETYDGNATELLNKVDIVTYNYKDDPEKKWHIGFLADYTPWEISGVNHDSMIVNHCVGMLIKAVQELSVKNKVLEEKIEKLTGGTV